MEKPETYEDLLRKAGVKNIHIVPRITHKTTASTCCATSSRNVV
jgi:homospermidine synthase